MSPMRGLDPEEYEGVRRTLRVTAASLLMGMVVLVVGEALIHPLLYGRPADLPLLSVLLGTLLSATGAILGVELTRTNDKED